MDFEWDENKRHSNLIKHQVDFVDAVGSSTMRLDTMRDNYDFSEGKRGAVVKTTKDRITIRLDPDIIQWFKDQVRGGGNYQSLINDALRHHVQRQGEPLESTLRRVIREEMHPV